MLLRVPWLLGVGYSSIPLFWLPIHPFAPTWRRLQWSPYRALLPLWAFVILLEIWITWPWHSHRLYSSPYMWLAAVPFVAVGLRTYRRISTEFGGRNLSGMPEVMNVSSHDGLVSTGMHSQMRHPIYLAHLCNFTGLAIGSGLTVNFVLLALSVFVTYPMMIAVEERELVRRFGEQYRIYQSQVPSLPYWRSLKPDPRKSATRLLEALLLELPSNSARLEVKDDYNARLVPSNCEAASIWCSGQPGQYIVGAGKGIYHEHLSHPAEVLAFCRDVMSGGLTEKLWTTENGVVASYGSGGNKTFTLSALNPFRKKSVTTRKYPPYAGFEGTNN